MVTQLSEAEITTLKELVEIAIHNGFNPLGTLYYPGYTVLDDPEDIPKEERSCNICEGCSEKTLRGFATRCFLIFCSSHARQLGLLW